MTMLDVLALVLACVALAFGVVAIARARSADEAAGQARADAAHACEQAEVAMTDAVRSGEEAQQARRDAASALDRAIAAQAEASSALENAQTARADAARALESHAETASGDFGSAISSGAGDTRPPELFAPVRWSLTHARGAIWLITNVGENAALSALLSDVTQPPKYVRPDEVIPREVGPGDHLQFRVLAGRNGPPPRVRVTWREDGLDDPKSRDMTLLLE